jgi:hypothetical protein
VLCAALALTDASPRAPQFYSTSREDKHTGFTVPPQTTRDLLGHPRKRETAAGRDWERNLQERGESEGRGRGRKEEQEKKVYSKPTRGVATSDDDDKSSSFSEANGARLHVP